MPAALLQPNVVNVVNAAPDAAHPVAGCTAINASTAQVKLTLGGPNYDILVGGIPIIPHKYWAAPCSWPVGSPEPAVSVLQVSQCADPGYDPMSAGILVGSSAYECIAISTAPNAGALGGPCSQNADGSPAGQVVSLGGRVLLTASPTFHRGGGGDYIATAPSKYQKFSWADKFDAGLVTIADLADAALHFKHYDAYWAHPSYSSTLTGTGSCPASGDPAGLNCVDIGVIATIASYIGIGATAPLSLGSAIGLDPHIDHYDSGIAPNPGGYVLAAKQTSSTTWRISVYGDNTVSSPITSVCAEADAPTEAGEFGTTGAACPVANRSSSMSGIPFNQCVASSPIAPDGPLRTTYTCTFTQAFTVNNSGIEVTFAAGTTTWEVTFEIPPLP